jgi:hypothetical protein
MGSAKKSVPLDSKEATDYLSRLLGVPVSYGSKETETEKEGTENE